jgi:hypothetical protein
MGGAIGGLMGGAMGSLIGGLMGGMMGGPMGGITTVRLTSSARLGTPFSAEGCTEICLAAI